MTGRRILSFIVALLFVAVLASAIAPREQAPRPTPSSATGVGSSPANVVEAALPPKREVRAEIGDVVTVRVRGEATDEVEIVELGVREPVEPDLPAELTFVADRTGRFAITLRDAGDRVGTVLIRPAGERDR